jgi:hypothetical protein
MSLIGSLNAAQKNLLPFQESNSAVQPIADFYTDRDAAVPYRTMGLILYTYSTMRNSSFLKFFS